MVQIGLLSDTHSYLDDAVFRHFESCDEIWHAGDFGNLQVAESLANFKPLRGVYGNIDGKKIRTDYPEHLKFTIAGMKVWMTHIGGYPGKYPAKIREELHLNSPDLFICGHSHILKVMFDKEFSCLHLNPGAAGKAGWHKVRTLLRFCISEGKILNLEAVELATR